MEPKPSKKFEKHDPKYYKKLNEFPILCKLESYENKGKFNKKEAI